MTNKRYAKIDSIIRNLNAHHNPLLSLSLLLSSSRLLLRLVFACRSIAIAVAAVELSSPLKNCTRRGWENKSHFRLCSFVILNSGKENELEKNLQPVISLQKVQMLRVLSSNCTRKKTFLGPECGQSEFPRKKQSRRDLAEECDEQCRLILSATS